MFGEQALAELVRSGGARGASTLCEKIYAAAAGHAATQSPEFGDDMTVMVAEYTG